MGRPSIICVDDEMIVLRSLKDELKIKFGSDYNIEIAESPDEALRLFEDSCKRKEEVPLIISDYIMPGMKGDKLLECIREINPYTVAILLTGQATLHGIANAVNYGGVFKCITKPWEKENLYLTVSEALGHYYNDRLREERNRKLKAINDELENTMQKKSEELEKTQRVFESTDRTAYIGQLIEEFTNEVNSSFHLIKSGVDMVYLHKKSICESNPESIATYMKSVEDFYKMASKVIDNLGDAFESNAIKYTLRPAESSGLVGEPDKMSLLSSRIPESTNGLLGKIKDFEKQFSKNIEKIAAWEDEEMLILSLNDVLYFTSEGGNTYVETKNGKYKVKDTLDLLEARLNAQNFFRCHRGFLVNLDYVNKIVPWISYSYILKLKGSSSEIPISRNRLKEMKMTLGI